MNGPTNYSSYFLSIETMECIELSLGINYREVETLDVFKLKILVQHEKMETDVSLNRKTCKDIFRIQIQFSKILIYF